MQTECVRCHKMIDTVQGYKFSPTEYVCMSCYDEYKAERVAKARKQHKNPLVDQFGTEGGTAATTETRQRATPKPAPSARQPQEEVEKSPSSSGVQPKPMHAPPVSSEDLPKTGVPHEKPAPAKVTSAAEVCDVCKQPLAGFKVPLTGGIKVCMTCNEVLRRVAKSLILNVQCPHCGKDIQLSQE